MRTLISLFLVGVVGCDGGSDTPNDAPPDAPPDAPLADAPVPPLGHRHYVIDRILVPTSNPEARAYGLDLDGDSMVDNALGSVMATFASMGIDVQVDYARAIDTGASITLVDLSATDLTTAAGSTFALFDGTNPMPLACNGASDTTCRRHLTGTGTFTAAATPVNAPLTGAIASGTMTAGPGQLAVDFVWPESPAVAVTLLGARIKASSITETGIATLILAGAIAETEVDAKIFPAIRTGQMAAMTRDCAALTSPPECGCTQGTSGDMASSLFDTSPKDCAISLDEIRN
ncbi:MAG: hypothetical protein H0T42_00665, partial [Deltaproteobacteria bacterium]|nr:hypothetical protein [Deltaproteobacteria bacterium]